MKSTLKSPNLGIALATRELPLGLKITLIREMCRVSDFEDVFKLPALVDEAMLAFCNCRW